ncbi:armadillo repeat protein [Niveomyces insectorum RCEF 264]|uniref:Armadillo repeat protein n=1 Tax=Niveomyces insectorum RCEF 264 TaxID=1081102 RepID=A0A167Y8D8_9HYPO|nr:armadillo repeat protein [Niveomyces insectorum RCEF 264]
MGKSRRSRSGAARRADPVGNRPRPVKALADPELAAIRTDKILPVVQDLRSADPKVRTTAAGAIANIVEDAKCRKLLLREQIVHTVLGETLADAHIESRAAGWEVLNVLAQHEESDFCVHLYRSDVLTPAAHALAQIVETLNAADTPFSKLTKAQQEFVWRLTSSVLDLVGQLADARDEILEAVVGNVPVTRALFALVSSTVAPLDIQWGALTCLARLCEDQRVLAEAVVDDQASGCCYAALLKLKEGGGPLAVAACALLHAVFAALEWFDHSPGRDNASDAVLVPALAACVDQQLQTDGPGEEGPDRAADALGLALQTLAMIGTTLKASLEKGNKDEEVWNGIQDDHGADGANGDLGDDDGDDDDGDDDEMLDDEAAGTKQAKANGTNASEQDESMDVDGDEHHDEHGSEDDDDDDDNDVDLDRDMEAVTSFDDKDVVDAPSLAADLPTLRALINDAIPPMIRLVAARLQDADADAVAVLREALAALNNMAWTVACIDLDDEGNSGIVQAWTPVALRAWRKVVRPLVTQDLVDRAVAAQVAGLAWALARVLRGATPTDAGELDKFMELRDRAAGFDGAGAGAGAGVGADSEDDDDDPLQSLAVKCVGVLGQLAQGAAPLDVNRRVGHYLVGLVDALPATPAAEAVEAFNQLFDLYGDEKAACDKAVFWADQLLEKLDAALPKAKAMAKTVDKRARTELRTRADEAVLNLRRFIQYKKKHAPR